MKTCFTVLLLLLTSGVWAQTSYESYEVDTPCEPQGGMALFQLFIQKNLRIPLKAQVDQIKGRVFVSGVVDSSGRIANVTIMRGLRPDCNREAIRVVSLFNAWKPATKGGKKVGQRVNYPISFPASSVCYYEKGKRIDYFDKTGQGVTADAADVVYKQVTPTDTTTGLPTGDLIVYKYGGKRWEEVTRNQLKWTPNKATKPEDQRIHLVYADAAGNWTGIGYWLYKEGSIESTIVCEEGRPTGNRTQYRRNGMLAMQEEYNQTSLAVVESTPQSPARQIAANKIVRTHWFANGQIEKVEVQDKRSVAGMIMIPKVMNLWDSTGTELVTDGNGQAQYTSWMPTRNGGKAQVAFVETGSIQNGVKEGVWTGRYADGSYTYKETYEYGSCKGGQAEAAGKVFKYDKQVEANPEFSGGMTALGAFLASNLQYPIEAQKNNVQGKVFISFVVNKDGSIDDVEILKGLSHGCNEEARRVVRAMPRWQPGMQRGEPVRVKFNLPIDFTLE